MSRREEILDAAERILSEEGIDRLSMRRLAEVVGVRAPSLYKHVADKAEVVAALQDRGLRALAGALAAAPPGVAALAGAYRDWALAHRDAYVVVTRMPLDRELLDPEMEEAAMAPVMRAANGDHARARALWGAVHGLVDLELSGRFPADADIDAAWRSMVAAFEE